MRLAPANGPHNVLLTIALSRIPDWIEVDSNYEREMAYKARVVRDHPDNTILSLAENDAGCGELLQTLVDYLPKVRRV